MGIVELLKGKNNYSKVNPLEFHEFGNNCRIYNCNFGLDKKLISIGNNVEIHEGTIFINYSPIAEHYNCVMENGNDSELRYLGPIHIKDNVFIGKNVLIYPGVTVGENSLIFDGTVIDKDIPANVVVNGNPASVIDDIFSWYKKLKSTNSEYPWKGKRLPHDRIVKEREKYFFG